MLAKPPAEDLHRLQVRPTHCRRGTDEGLTRVSTFEDLTRQIIEFRDPRDWKQFHSPRNLAASISIEAAELLEIFQWNSDETLAEDAETNRTDIERELADIVIYCLLMAHDTSVDLQRAVQSKLTENDSTYPIGSSRGKRAKYTEL